MYFTMKKNNKRLIFILILLFLAFISLFLINKSNDLFSKAIPKPFFQIKKEAVTNLNIINNNKKTNLYKKSAHWYLKIDNAEFNADNNRINKIIDTIIALEKEDVVSTNPKKHPEFEIQKNSLAIQTENQSYILFVGKNAGYTKNYLRINNDNDIFIASGFDSIFFPEDFRDLSTKLLSQENDVSKIQINFDEKNIILEKKKDDWHVNDKKVKKDRVDFFLNDFKTLKAEDILKKDSLDLASLQKELTIRITEKDKENTTEFYSFPNNQNEKYKNRYALMKSHSDSIYLVASINVDSFKKQENDFIE